MNNDYSVKTEFVNKDTGERFARVYPLDAFCNNASFELKQVLYDVENVFYQLENFKDRSEWSEDSKETFFKIRKKLLNNINNVARLPYTLCCNGVPINSIPASELLARIIDNK